GIRMSAESTEGMLTMGQNTNQPNGINAISGYMRTTQITGNAPIMPLVFSGPSDPCRNPANPCNAGSFPGNNGSAYTGNLSIEAQLRMQILFNLNGDLSTITNAGLGTGIAISIPDGVD